MKLGRNIDILNKIVSGNKKYGLPQSTITFSTEELDDLLKQLQDYRSLKKEIVIYKKALKMACRQITNLDCDGACDLFGDCKCPCKTLDCDREDTWVEFYLVKARESNG